MGGLDLKNAQAYYEWLTTWSGSFSGQQDRAGGGSRLERGSRFDRERADAAEDWDLGAFQAGQRGGSERSQDGGVGDEGAVYSEAERKVWAERAIKIGQDAANGCGRLTATHNTSVILYKTGKCKE